MAGVLKIFDDNMIKDHTTWWLILECGHWYHWTGNSKPNSNNIDCPSCGPLISIKKYESNNTKEAF